VKTVNRLTEPSVLISSAICTGGVTSERNSATMLPRAGIGKLLGSHATNDVLARQRADLIRSELIRLGVAAQNIEVIGRGKREECTGAGQRGPQSRPPAGCARTRANRVLEIGDL